MLRIVPYNVRCVAFSADDVALLESQFVYEGGELGEPWKEFGSKEAIRSIIKRPAALANAGECSCTIILAYQI